MSKLVVGLFERLATIPLGSLLYHPIEGNVLTEVLAQNPELVLWVLMEQTSAAAATALLRGFLWSR
jgi:hypothetical protein